jgi:hypothetical protein
MGFGPRQLESLQRGKRSPGAKVSILGEGVNKFWRERMGVGPTMDTVGYPSTDLKSAKLTGAHSPPKAMLDSP